ncbi:helicase-related protein [Agaribacterium haliotis]|uniref:helicase-related protein n=1 Tax=Agaribacterium haliotis TaxID=2013869 RepID=UPI000BB5672D|nr:helicase-related protein [Agaribacterium haliotis]
MSEFVQGQRWVVDSEPELGLGIVVAIEGRSVNLFFPVGDCERRYALDQAPLTRIHFQEGEEIKDLDGKAYKVKAVHEQGGLLIYETDQGSLVVETQLSPEIQLNQPFMRLLMGQIDRRRWFNFRREFEQKIARLNASRLNGLLGARADLIAHQLYVANTACNFEKVRVLLADEVGLGKTIEAGLILNRLLKQERVSRVLIAVPPALQVQWLVELIRRFGISPVLYNEEDHDFNGAQIHLLPHWALSLEREEILEAGFDLLIIDEAHHVELASKEFSALEQMAAAFEHLVLMTATPEQLGFDSHFARLNLLDANKYSSAEALKQEEQGYEALNKLLRDMPESRDELCALYQLDSKLDDQTLISEVLDCHGVGRTLFRNARTAVAGFPKRVAHKHSIDSGEWQARFDWLAEFLKQHAQEKVLVIMHSREHVAECENFLWQNHGIDSATFHEQMSLVERDRAAAYFADMEEGTRVLLCSEIGSEGRNFQFSNKLVCLDLPEHPDLLEQRIGRLDRIGQQRDVEIHVPSSANCDNAQRWSWYHQVLNCVEQQNPAAAAVHDELCPHDLDDIDEALIQQAQAKIKTLLAEIHQGRDALLELNSCRQPQADKLVEQIREFEAQSPLSLVEEASDLLNFHFEELGGGRYSLIPSDSMLIPLLPGIPAEGVEISFDRALANTREDVIFMSWDHSFIQGLWELLKQGELGSACVAMLPSRQLPPGKLLMECSFDVAIQSEYAQDLLPFFTRYSVRVVSSELAQKDLAPMLSEAQLQESLLKVDKKLARKIIKSQKDRLPEFYQQAEQYALAPTKQLVDEALLALEKHFDIELQRLRSLAEKNDAVGEQDIQQLQQRKNNMAEALTHHAVPQLSAIRLIVTNKP